MHYKMTLIWVLFEHLHSLGSAQGGKNHKDVQHFVPWVISSLQQGKSRLHIS